MTAAFPKIATGSIVRVISNGSRATNGEPIQIPAIVLSQYPEDGQVRLFCFHFEGQYLALVQADQVEVVMDVDYTRALPANLAVPLTVGNPGLEYATSADLQELRSELDKTAGLITSLRALMGHYARKTELQELRNEVAQLASEREGKAVADA